MKLLNHFVTTVYAQTPGGGTAGGLGITANPNGNNFTLDQFNFLNPLKNTNFNTLVGRLIGIMLTLAAFIAFIYLLVAGFQYITAGGDAAKAGAARTAIVNALIGIIVILIAYVILRFVGSQLITGS